MQEVARPRTALVSAASGLVEPFMGKMALMIVEAHSKGLGGHPHERNGVSSHKTQIKGVAIFISLELRPQ